MANLKEAALPQEEVAAAMQVNAEFFALLQEEVAAVMAVFFVLEEAKVASVDKDSARLQEEAAVKAEFFVLLQEEAASEADHLSLSGLPAAEELLRPIDPALGVDTADLAMAVRALDQEEEFLGPIDPARVHPSEADLDQADQADVERDLE